MSYVLRPALYDGATFSGQLVYPTTVYEVDERLLKYIESISYSINDQYVVKNTGFEKKKYKQNGGSIKEISIILVGNLPFWMHEILIQLAISVNGAGMLIEFKDTIIAGTPDNPVVHDCRWVNAGDFVGNNELLNGGTIQLVVYSQETIYTPSGGEFQKVIDTPVSDLEWDLKIVDGDATFVYYRVK